MKEIDYGNIRMYFFNASCGTGKTFLISLMLGTVRARSEIAVAIASSKIAATLLEGGRIAHSVLKHSAIDKVLIVLGKCKNTYHTILRSIKIC